MTLAEAKDLAAGGNVNAMMALADYYSKDTSNEKYIELANEYYRRAAEQGEPTAIMKMAQVSYRVASTMLKMTDLYGVNEDILRCVQDSYRWTQKLVGVIEQLNIQGEAANSANEFYLDSVVWLSAIYCINENFSEIKRITENISHPVAKALHGRALYELAGPGDEVETAFKLMENAKDQSFWSPKYSSPKILEHQRVTIGSVLSVLYRVLYQNIDAAYDVTAMMLRHTKAPEIREALQEDISCYKKSLFGGYKYIG